MVALDPAPLAEGAVAVASPITLVGSLAAIGVLGVTDWILGDDEPPDESEDAVGDGGSGMFDEPDTAGDGGMAGMGDDGDEFAFDDDGGDDAFDDFDVGGMDEEGGGGGAQVRELEGRVDEIEDELSSISSTVSTVRTENEQISESVDDIEENVRKLLDIYKMVTKGVNPFVDEDGGGFSGAEGSSLGLFDQEDEDDEQPGQLDEDVTDANAEEFFDDDFEDDEADDAAGADEIDDTDESMAQSDDAPTDEEGGAKSFDELREEYEDGAEWGDDEAEEEADEETDAHAEAESSDEAASGDDEAPAPDDAEEEAAAEDGVDDERVDALFEEDEELQDDDPEPDHAAGAHQPPAQPASPPATQTPPRTGARQPVTSGGGDEKPYLRELPSGYVSDLLVMEWVEFLVTESSPAGAHRAITYYENVGWIGHRAADQLREFVDGHPEAAVEEDDASGTDALTMDHHTTSLRYVARITGDVQENVLDSWDDGDNRWLHR